MSGKTLQHKNMVKHNIRYSYFHVLCANSFTLYIMLSRKLSVVSIQVLYCTISFNYLRVPQIYIYCHMLLNQVKEEHLYCLKWHIGKVHFWGPVTLSSSVLYYPSTLIKQTKQFKILQESRN